MTNQTETAFETEVAMARNQCVRAVLAGDQSFMTYAAVLNEEFPFDWFDINLQSDKSNQAGAVKAEQTAFYSALKDAKYSNPSVPWSRIKKYAKTLRYGPEEKEAPAQRSPALRNIEELVKLYKFNMALSPCPEPIAKANDHIAAALKAIGVGLPTV